MNKLKRIWFTKLSNYRMKLNKWREKKVLNLLLKKDYIVKNWQLLRENLKKLEKIIMLKKWTYKLALETKLLKLKIIIKWKEKNSNQDTHNKKINWRKNILKLLNNMRENCNKNQIIINKSWKELRANMEMKLEH